MAAENIGNLFPTKIPGYQDPADIQEAFRLYHYGTLTYDLTNTDPSNLPSPSIAKHLQTLTTAVEKAARTGGDYLSSMPTSPTDGYIWVDASSSSSGVPIYTTAVYSSTAPTDNLSDGVIWVDKSKNPLESFIYDSNLSAWKPMSSLPSIVDNVGDLVYGTADNVVDNLPIGTDGQVLKVSSGLPSWQTEKTWVSKGSGSLTGSTISVSGLNGEKLYIVLNDWSHNDITDVAKLSIRFNNNTGPYYINTGGSTASSSVKSPSFSNTVANKITISVDLANTTAAIKTVSTIADTTPGQYFGYFANPSPITSIQISLSPSGSFDNGTYEVWSYE